MKPTNYQNAKSALKEVAEMAKSQFKNDKPMIRQIINDSAYIMESEYKLSEYQIGLLHNYACTLHP